MPPKGTFFPALHALSQPSSSPPSLIVRLTSDVNIAIDTSGDLEALFWDIWNSVLAAASATAPAEQQKLVDVVKALAQQPVLKDKKGNAVQVWDAKVWPDLPVFGAAVREAFNVGEIEDEEEQRQWIYLNAFLARLTAENGADSEDGPLDFALYAIWALRDVLEGKDAVASVPKFKIATAKAWIEQAGPLLQQLSDNHRTFDGQVARPGPGYEDKQWKGFTKDRWELWTSKLQGS